MHLVRNADEDKRGDHHVENWVPWNENQDAVSVRSQPDVVLADKELKQKRVRLVGPSKAHKEMHHNGYLQRDLSKPGKQ